MSDIPKKFTSEYYDEHYFKTPRGKKFRHSNGTCDGWSYSNPNGESLACGPITKAWKKMFEPAKSLDVGTGRGTVVAYARDIGIEAYGFDFSEWSVNEGRYPRCKLEWLKVHDATKPWPYKNDSFDLVTALDFWEHIYLREIPFVIKEMYRIAKKWIFLQIAVAGSGGLQGREEQGYILKKGDPIPIELEGCAVAGHVTLRKELWWYEQFEHDDWIPRRDMVKWFITLVPKENIRNWLLNSIIVMEHL